MYPTLTEMGINTPAEISSYDYFEGPNDEDILRIRYRRKTGSLLPESRVYRFRRVGAGTPGTAEDGAVEISPTLSGAIVELDSLLAARGDVASLASQIDEALKAVELEVARVRSLTKQIMQTTGA